MKKFDELKKVEDNTVVKTFERYEYKFIDDNGHYICFEGEQEELVWYSRHDENDYELIASTNLWKMIKEGNDEELIINNKADFVRIVSSWIENNYEPLSTNFKLKEEVTSSVNRG